jgi:UDP-N-acetylglucosamine--N-acetylmuramyl-(pentapeptide) pyrophosphoryl-undecaprenol N-acetylglucosamine transferase
MKRFLISCGGTGGHLSPGIALGEALVARGHKATLLISNKKVDARLIEKYAHLTFLRIPGAPFTLNPVGFARFFFKQSVAFFFGVNLVRKQRPDAIIGFGGFTTSSVIVAGALFNVPVVLHEANRVPGRAIRLLGRLARRVYLPPGVRLPDVRMSALRHMGLPVRKEIVREPREAALQAFGLDPHFSVLVVLGGSQGATPLNDWACKNAESLALEGVQVCCVTGLGKREPEVLNFRTRRGEPIKATFFPFCDRMGALLSAADLVVSRAGAGTIAELIRCTTPAILIPYPFAADNHQWANARFFEMQGGGLVIAQERLKDLTGEVHDVVFNDWLMRKFKANLQRMDRANSLDNMLDDLEELSAPATAPSLAQPKPA